VEYDKAIELNPNSWQAYLGKGWSLWDYDIIKCIENIQVAISLNHGPEIAVAFQAIGTIYGSLGFLEKTEYYYNEDFNKNKDTLQYFRNQRWLAAEYEGDYNKALELDKKILTVDSVNIDSYYQFGVDYVRDRQPGLALRYLKEYLKRKPKSLRDDDYFGLHLFAWVYLQVGDENDKKEAVHLLNLQIERLTKLRESGTYSGMFRVYHDLACAYAILGDKKKAYENLRLLLKLKIYDLWLLNLIKHDPYFDGIRNEPEFRQIFGEFEAIYQREHEKVRKWLEDQEMLN